MRYTVHETSGSCKMAPSPLPSPPPRPESGSKTSSLDGAAASARTLLALTVLLMSLSLSTRLTTPPSALPHRLRFHYHHHRHSMSPGRNIMTAPAHSVTPRAPAFEARLPEYSRQSFHPHPEDERRGGSRLHRSESVRMLSLDLGNKGEKTLDAASSP